MNISGFISSVKEKVRARADEKDLRVAQNLAQLKKDRMKAEGRAKLYNIQASEQAKLAKAKSSARKQRFESSFLGKATKVAGAVGGAVAKEAKAHHKTLKNKPKVSFLSEQSTSPFALNKPVAVKKKKKSSSKTITIKIN